MLAEPDYGGRIDYPSIFERIGKLQTDQLQAQGADPFIGRKLPALLSQAGLHNIHTALIGGHWSGPPDPDNWSLEWDVLEDDLRGRLPADELKDCVPRMLPPGKAANACYMFQLLCLGSKINRARILSPLGFSSRQMICLRV
jgi:hypothetical protein